MQQKKTHKKNKNQKKIKIWKKTVFFLSGVVIGSAFLLSSVYFIWERASAGRVYPGVRIEEKDFGGKTEKEVESYFRQKNTQILLKFDFAYQDKISTVSAQTISWGYDEKMIAAQAIIFGRSGNFLSDFYQRILAAKAGYNLHPAYVYSEQKLADVLKPLADKVDTPPQEALFNFSGGRVTAFRPSVSGQALDIEEAQKETKETLFLLKKKALPSFVKITLNVKPVAPEVTTGEVNNLGIKELVGRGSSRFAGSIANRVYNIGLAAGRLNGILVAPGDVFSFNKALGDVSKFTGYREAYIIKDGRTVLGDGGGVCQVSTTLFRALLNSGLTITERHPHSYRVGYYEQGSPPGIDASVYDPAWDLKFKNDTVNHLLIQSYVDFKTATLVFELYGAKDGRVVEISKPIIKNQVAPPDDLYQDDPALPKGEIKQVDWKAWGADVSFTRIVKKGGEIIINEKFSSHYQPWKAIYLRGTKEGP